MGWMNYRGKKIHYDHVETNPKTLLVFIHGSGGDANTWKHQMLENDLYSSLALDLPSHGKSDKFETLSLDLYVDVFKFLVDTLDYERVIACGHSLGGAIIQTFYFKYPQYLEALVLMSTGAKLRVSPAILDSLRSDYEKYLKYLNMVAFSKKTSDSVIEEYKDDSSLVGAEVTYRDFKICDNFNLFDKTNLIRAQCLIICGVDDKLTPIKYSKYFHSKIDDSKLVLIENAGHMVMLEKAKEVNKTIRNFVKGLE
ncbi:MAG: alpha/beta hydrolase [Promethearchaeota archaeon]|nr:MAG: alpha/beta hydrolase [Candidatus Lokiarchaeota archaeon]